MQNHPQDSTYRSRLAKERAEALAASAAVCIPKGIASSAKIPISFIPIGFIPPLPPLPPVSSKVCATDLHESLILDFEETLSVQDDLCLRNNQEPDRKHQALPNLTGYKKKKSLKNKFKDKVGILLAAVLGSGLLGGYFLCQSKFSAFSAATFSESTFSASTANNDFKFTHAIASQSMLTSTHTFIADIETSDRKSEQKMEKLLAAAQAKYNNTGSLKEVKPLLQNIPSNSRVRSKADKLLSQWQLDAKKNEAGIKKAEKALNEGNWQVAIASVKGISSTPYWQKRGSIIAAEAKQRLARALAAPVPISAPPIQSSNQLSNQGYAPVEPEYVPPYQAPVYEPPTYYEPPTRSDREPARSYAAPVPAAAPPPPRVAQ